MDVSQLDEAMEITMRTKRKDGSWSSRPIWIVVVDDASTDATAQIAKSAGVE